MAVKLTQEQADELDKSVGAIPIGEYKNSRTKREYKCINCNNSYFVRPNDIKTHKQIYCSQCGRIQGNSKRKHSIDYVKQTCIDNGFEPLFDKYINNKTKIKVRCRCGNELNIMFQDIKSGHIQSCGHCNDPKIGDRFSNLTITHIKPGQIGCSVKCICDCGNILSWHCHYQIVTGWIKSCGHCNDINIGDRFGSFIIIDVKTAYNGGCQVKCKCDCGNITKWYPNNIILSGNTKSCGHCKLRRNGRTTSHIALRLHDIVEQITDCKWEHNHHIPGLGCVDIANIELKIAIEYDGYYYHMVKRGDRSEYDKEKYSKLITNGWKLLNIKSDGDDIPTEKQLRKILLNDFQHGSYKRTITMKSWKQQEKEHGENKL